MEYVCWAPNGNWLASCSSKDFTCRIWDVSSHHEEAVEERIKLKNQMVCTLERHREKIYKIVFYSDSVVISCSQDKTIIIWEIQAIRLRNQRESHVQYKAREVRKIKASVMYVEIAVTSDLFLCRRGNP
jgi:WD40 repeat protein